MQFCERQATVYSENYEPGGVMLTQIGQRIKQMREAHSIKQNELAQSLYVTPQAVSKWERGENLPDTLMLVKIASMFRVSLDFIVRGI